jgi:hypothetical protein
VERDYQEVLRNAGAEHAEAAADRVVSASKMVLLRCTEQSLPKPRTRNVRQPPRFIWMRVRDRYYRDGREEFYIDSATPERLRYWVKDPKAMYSLDRIRGAVRVRAHELAGFIGDSTGLPVVYDSRTGSANREIDLFDDDALDASEVRALLESAGVGLQDGTLSNGRRVLYWVTPRAVIPPSAGPEKVHPPAAPAAQEVPPALQPQPGEFSKRRVDVLAGEVETAEFLRFLCDYTGLPVFTEMTPRQLNVPIVVVSQVNDADDVLVKELLRVNGFGVTPTTCTSQGGGRQFLLVSLQAEPAAPGKPELRLPRPKKVDPPVTIVDPQGPAAVQPPAGGSDKRKVRNSGEKTADVLDGEVELMELLRFLSRSSGLRIVSALDWEFLRSKRILVGCHVTNVDAELLRAVLEVCGLRLTASTQATEPGSPNVLVLDLKEE